MLTILNIISYIFPHNFNITLPDDILIKIFRSNKETYNLSRMVSKPIRNLSLSSILQHEILLPISKEEIMSIVHLPHTLISRYYGIIIIL